MSTDTVVLNGYEHYLTSNGIRTFIGPVRHRASRRVSRARAAIAAKFNRNKENPVQPLSNDEPETTVIPAIRQGDPNETTANIAPVSAQVTRMLEGLKLPTFHVNPPKPANHKGKRRGQTRWAEIKEAVMDRLYDSSWHEMVQNTAKTIIYVAVVASAILVLIKSLIWVVML